MVVITITIIEVVDTINSEATTQLYRRYTTVTADHPVLNSEERDRLDRHQVIFKVDHKARVHHPDKESSHLRSRTEADPAHHHQRWAWADLVHRLKVDTGVVTDRRDHRMGMVDIVDEVIQTQRQKRGY